MDADAFERAVRSSRPVVASVTARQLDQPTTCQSWKVRDLINHMIEAPTFAAVVMETGIFEDSSAESVDHSSEDFLAKYDAATSRALAAFKAEGSMERIVKLPFGDMPGSVFVNIATGDAFMHGWDLEKSTGANVTLDDQLAAEILEGVRPLLPDSFIGQDGKAPFGPEVAVPETASATDRLAGFLGRQP
jgi:uncharacterized protein (TIGR03086 family)